MSQVQERPTLFAQTINEMNRGRLPVEMDELLMDVTKAVTELGGTGEITAGYQLSAKKPQKKTAESVFFVDEHSRLIRDDPKQKQMFSPEQLEKKAA